jgi:hypothetical protein
MLSRKVFVGFYTSLLTVAGLNLFEPVPSADGLLDVTLYLE